jgi:hypothetical protein
MSIIIAVLIHHIHHHNDAIGWALFVPAMESDDLGPIVKMIEMDILTAQPRVTPDRLRRRAIRSRYMPRIPCSSSTRDQSIGTLSWNQRSSSNSCPSKIIGIPGEVRTRAPPNVERFLENQLSALPGQISSGTRARPLATRVVRLGINDPFEGILIIAMLNSFTDCPQIAGSIITGNNGLANMVNKIGIPLRIEAGAARSYIFSDPGLFMHPFGDADFTGNCCWISTLIHCIRLQPSGMSLAGFSILPSMLLIKTIMSQRSRRHGTLRATSKRYRGCIGALRPGHNRDASRPRVFANAVIVEVDSPFPIFAPTVKLPQIKIRGAKVVVNDIYDDGDTMLVGRLHKPLKCIRPAVKTFNGKGMRRIVTPRKFRLKTPRPASLPRH